MRLWESLKDNVSRNLAFCPPIPATYGIKPKDGSDEYPQEVTLAYPRLPSSTSVKLYRICTPLLGDGGGGKKIVVAFIAYNNFKSPHTLLYSHPNALDLGNCIPYCIELSKTLRVNILTFDYTGYGCSEGQPSVTHTRADITAAYEFLTNNYDMSAESIILMGASLGSAPSTYLASKLSHMNLAGLILQSPLLSGVRVLKPSLKWWPSCIDVFPNFMLIKGVSAPTLVMHGTDDEVIDIEHGKQLHQLAPNPNNPPLWAKGYTHQNLSLSPDYIPRLQAFLDDVWG